VIGIGSSILLDQPPVIAKERYPPIVSSWVASLNRVVPRNILPLYRSPTTDVKHASSRVRDRLPLAALDSSHL